MANTIKNWNEDERPREKMLQKGAAALTDAELLAILISTGTREKSALDLAREVLATAKNNLQEMGRMPVRDLKKVKGIGEAKAITLAAAMELGRRRQLSAALERPKVLMSKEAAEIFMPMLNDLAYEAFAVLYMDVSCRVIHAELISHGGLTSTVADIRIILKNALLQGASRLMVAHNHPSGNMTPSEIDKRLTKSLMEAAMLMDMRLLDHLIIGAGNYYSMADMGLM